MRKIKNLLGVVESNKLEEKKDKSFRSNKPEEKKYKSDVPATPAYIRYLLLVAREKDVDSPFYKDNLPRDMFRIILFLAVQSISFDLDKIKEWSQILFTHHLISAECAMDVCQDINGRIILSDTARNEISIFDTETKITSTISGKDFASPKGVTTDQQRNIIVCDTYNNALKIFDKDLKFLKTITKEDEPKLKEPTRATVDREGRILVAQCHAVHIFSPNGVWLKYFDLKGSNPGRGFNAIGATHSAIYVTDWHNQVIQKFNYKGEHIESFRLISDSGTIGQPYGLVVDSSDRLVITDYSNGTIHFFDQKGNEIHVLNWKKFSYPSGIAITSRGGIAISEVGGKGVTIIGELGGFKE